MSSIMPYERSLAASHRPHMLGRLLAGVGLVTVVAKVLKAGRRRALRRAAWHNALGRHAGQPLPIDQLGAGASGPVHRIAVG